MKTKYSNIKSLPLRDINITNFNDIDEDTYQLMLEYCWRTTKNEDDAYEILHGTLLKYAEHINRNPHITISGGLFVLIERSVRFDSFNLSNKFIKEEPFDAIDDRTPAGHKYDTELKLIAADKAIQTLTEYQRELFLFSLTTKKIDLARALDVPVTTINKELKEITKYIQQYCDIELNK